MIIAIDIIAIDEGHKQDGISAILDIECIENQIFAK